MSDFLATREAAANIASYYLPELPEAEASVIHERLVAAERAIASPTLLKTGYELGTAVYPNEIIEQTGSEPLLLSAEHATDHWKNLDTAMPEPKEADWGTAGLTFLLHQDLGASMIIPRGWQTGNANSQEQHKIKEAIERWFRKVQGVGYTSIHGMKNGRIGNLTDTKAYDVAIGIGDDLSPETAEFAERAVMIAKDLGLRAGINPDFVRFKDDQPVITDGKPESFVFGGSHPLRTRSFARRQAEAMGKRMPIAQIELSGLLRLQPLDSETDNRSRVIGPYMGYKFMEAIHKPLLSPPETPEDV